MLHNLRCRIVEWLKPGILHDWSVEHTRLTDDLTQSFRGLELKDYSFSELAYAVASWMEGQGSVGPFGTIQPQQMGELIWTLRCRAGRGTQTIEQVWVRLGHRRGRK